MFRILAALAAVLVALGACSSDGRQAQTVAVAPIEPTATPLPTTSPINVPTATPLPTATAAPTATVAPTATSIPAPTATAPPATAPPVPTATDVPAPAPTEPPLPTATAEVPTATPEPTATPQPSATADAGLGTGGSDGTAHEVSSVGYVTLGVAGSTTLRIPAALVELIGFHEASHPGSQAINAAGTGLDMIVLESRGRGTPARSAADIVVPPGEPLRAPVTGTVVASTTYVLYCEHEDKLVYIEPDGLPGWQVRLFHVRGDTPAVGTRVISGETIVASGGANPLPFESQIDEFTAEPSWPHVHLEIVDTSVPDDRPPGGGC